MDQQGFFGLQEHLERLSEIGDPLEVLDTTVDFEYFRGWLIEGLGYGDGAKSGRPPYDPVSMFKVLICPSSEFFGELGPFCNGGSGSVSV